MVTFVLSSAVFFKTVLLLIATVCLTRKGSSPHGLSTGRSYSSSLCSITALTQVKLIIMMPLSLIEYHDKNYLLHIIYSSSEKTRAYRVPLVCIHVLFLILHSPFTDLFDREYRHSLQRVPRDLSSLLEAKDHPPSGRALYCRRNFGPLQVI